MKRHEPKAAKGSIRVVEVACTAWIDLLGYGSMLEEASFDLLDAMAEKAIERLHSFHEIVAKKSSRYFPTFVMNDGAIAYRDMSPRARSVTYDFLKRSIDLFNEINDIDQNKLGHPGARMVFAAGFRARRRNSFEAHLNSNLANTIREKVYKKEISIDQAINAALKARQTHDLVPELQANFAMTKAYLADSSGSKAGFGGPNCFIDLCIFKPALPSWITFDVSVPWSARGISGRFGRFSSIDNEEAGKVRHEGILDAFDIAENISKVTNAAKVLKLKNVRNYRMDTSR